MGPRAGLDGRKISSPPGNDMIESKIMKKTHKMFKFSSMFRENPESHSRNVVWKKIILIYA